MGNFRDGNALGSANNMDLWLTTDGNLAEEDSGVPLEGGVLLECDDCPCSSCADGPIASSYTVLGNAEIPDDTIVVEGACDEDVTVGYDTTCPCFQGGSLPTAGWVVLKVIASGMWTIARHPGSSPGAKNDGIDHPVGTYNLGRTVV